MPDLTRCSGVGCPLRDDCLRYRAKVIARFDAFGTPPYDAATTTCAEHRPLASIRPTRADVARRAHDRWLAAGRPDGRADEHWLAAEADLEASFRYQVD